MPRRLIFSIAMLCALPVNAEVVVTVEPLQQLASAVEVTYSANVEPLDRGLVSAGIGSEILSIHARVGDAVTRGQRLVLLDCRDAELAASLAREAEAEAEVRFAFAERQAARVDRLAASNIASEELKDTRGTEVRLARRQLAKARVNLEDAVLQRSRCEVLAPYDAVIVRELASVGTRVAVGTPIMELVSQAIEVRARLPLDVRVLPDASVRFSSALGDVAVTLKSEGAAVDTETGTRLVRFLGQSPLLEPGAPGRIRIQSGRLGLSTDYLVERSGQVGVMVVDDDLAQFIPRPNAVLGQPVDVGDLDPQTLVIRDGRFRVRDGETVVINP